MAVDRALRVVVAPDSFKGSMAAPAAAAAIAAGWGDVRPGDRITTIPQADGGEGTLDAIAAAVPGSERREAGAVTGPDGRAVDAHWLLLPDGEAVVELAVSSGLPLMARPDPLGATTRGLGEVIGAALDAGATSVTIALGGSASTDGGTGALAALGARFLSRDGDELPDGGGGLARLERIDVSRLRTPPAVVRVLTDVSSPLLGQGGAAMVFGEQKGATPGQREELDAALANFARVAGGDAARPGTGAAGGTAYGLVTLWGATIEPGAAEIARVTALTDALGAADVVLTGEGRFDEQSTRGKVVGEILSLAGDAGVAAAVVAGMLDADPGCPAWSLADLAGSGEAARADAGRWLREAGRAAATSFSRGG